MAFEKGISTLRLSNHRHGLKPYREKGQSRPEAIDAESGAAGKMTGMPNDLPAATDFRRLLLEAFNLCQRARNLPLKEVETIAIQRHYGSITDGTRITFAFQGSLRRNILSWLRRADLAVRTAMKKNDVIADAAQMDLLSKLRHLVDTANVAFLLRSKGHHRWAMFCLANEQTKQHQ